MNLRVAAARRALMRSTTSLTHSHLPQHLRASFVTFLLSRALTPVEARLNQMKSRPQGSVVGVCGLSVVHYEALLHGRTGVVPHRGGAHTSHASNFVMAKPFQMPPIKLACRDAMAESILSKTIRLVGCWDTRSLTRCGTRP